jgi:16S rRNA G966 N2-methylase RsmD
MNDTYQSSKTLATLEVVESCSAMPSVTASTGPHGQPGEPLDNNGWAPEPLGQPSDSDQPDQTLAAIPPLTELEYAALKADIRVHGIHVPIMCDETGNVLDGHHRRRIAEELQSEGIAVEYNSIIVPGMSQSAKYDLSMRLNLNRRHLSRQQHRDLIADYIKKNPDKSNRSVATLMRMSPTTVGSVRSDLEARGDVSTLDTRTDAIGRRQPATKRRLSSASVLTKNSRETERALQALNGLAVDALPCHAVDVKRLERIRRETIASNQAAVTPVGRMAIGVADIRFGNMTSVLSDIGDDSVDLVLTDPPYGQEYLHVWDDLGDLAARVLRPGGLLVTYSGQAYLPKVMAALSERLEYVWTTAAIGKGAKYQYYPRRIHVNWKPVLVFAKPPLECAEWVSDILLGDGPEKDLHDWQQGESEAQTLIERYSQCNDLIVDPFLGSGTTAAAGVALGRRVIGCDVDPIAVGKSRERVRVLLSAAP